MRKVILALIFGGSVFVSEAQPADSLKANYQQCLDSLDHLLVENGALKKAVFLVENCYLEGGMSYIKFDSVIGKLSRIVTMRLLANPIREYHFDDSDNVGKNLSLFKTLKDTTTIILPGNKKYYFLPYTYDFNDFFGDQAWENMFVTKLLSTHTGNCHSLPYLYKILADEIGAKCWLALAPNHMYISNRCKQIGWYNTELTSGDFPIDAWIMASGYLPIVAVQNGIYMDTLSNSQSIALCMLDLAKGYEHKTGNYTDGFIIKCCDLSLRYFPLNVQAMLLKAKTLQRVYMLNAHPKTADAQDLYHQMESLYVKLFDLGYREMPDKMYMEWLQSVVKEREKYANKELKATLLR
jgi:hypothetical protein